MHDPLRKAISTAQSDLKAQLNGAATAVREQASNREVIQRTDAFLIQAVRHLSAVCDVILPAARTELPDGETRVREYVEQARRVERAVAQAKRRLYGESHAIHLTWLQVWSELGTEFRQLNALERKLVADLSKSLAPAARRALADRIGNVEATSPTRPHPNLPHTGRFAHLSRGVLARADRLWDAAEGRIVSRPAKAPTAKADKVA